jgi:hypothetical protein
MADEDDESTFPYEEPRTGKIEQRPRKPNFWQLTKERLVDSGSIQKQREVYEATQKILRKPDKSKYRE